jgi:hypothetical protein
MTMAMNLEFAWNVNADGYTWVKVPIDLSVTVSATQWRLAEICPPAGQPSTRLYEPLRDFTGLFLTLADTEPTRDGIVKFASRFGCLGGSQPSPPNQTVQNKAGRTARLTAEPWELWQRQISDLQQASQLWQWCQVGDMESLAAHIRWEESPGGERAVSYVSHAEADDGETTASGHVATREPIAARTFHPERLDWFRPGDLMLPALVYAQDKINTRLSALVGPRLLREAGEVRLALRLVPRTLLGALWLQFAQAIAEDKAFRRCAECGLWFELSPSVGRKDKRFCSGACRTRAHRGRREKAWQLHKQGRSARDIARELDSDAATVKGWLAGFKA